MAGLLDLAQRSLDRRRNLAGPFLGIENTLLYRREYARFEAALGEGTANPGSSWIFYKGYARMLAGDKAGALRVFRMLDPRLSNTSRFSRLVSIFDFALQGKKEEARKRLNFLFEEQMVLRAPDAEFTFKLAEASALADDPGRAMDLASRSAAQGFGCTEWYERSPLLEPLRGQPRFKALLKILHDRQARLEARFPAKLFGL